MFLFREEISPDSSFGEDTSLPFDTGDKSVKTGDSGGETAFLMFEFRGRGLRFASSFFHFIRLFWNQIFIWRSVRFNMAASSILRGREMYLLKWNSFSSSRSWPRVYAVRVRLLSSSRGNWAPEKRVHYKILFAKIDRWSSSTWWLYTRLKHQTPRPYTEKIFESKTRFSQSQILLYKMFYINNMTVHLNTIMKVCNFDQRIFSCSLWYCSQVLKVILMS